MGEVCAWIQVGGRLDAADVPQLAEAIAAAGLAIDFDHACQSVAEPTDEIALAAAEGLALELFTDDAVSDRFRGIEAACRAFGLSYTSAVDGDYARSPMVSLWQPGMNVPKEWVGRAEDHVPCLAHDDVRAHLAAGSLETELDLMARASIFDRLLVIGGLEGVYTEDG